MSIIYGKLIPNSVKMTSSVVDVLKNACITIKTEPEARLNEACYKITTVTQMCSYEYGYSSGVSDAHSHIFNLTPERYGMCFRNEVFKNAYIEGFKKIIELEYLDKSKEPVLSIKTIDNEPITDGVNYDYQTDTYYATQTSTIIFFDYDFIIGRLYVLDTDDSGSTIDYNYDGSFTWVLNEDELTETTYVNVQSIDLNKTLSDISELSVTIMEKTNTPELTVIGNRALFNKSRINCELTVTNFKKGFRVYPDGMPVETKDIDINSIYYEDFIKKFVKDSGTTYSNGSFTIYSEVDGDIGTFPFSIENGKFSVNIEKYVSRIEKLKFVFKVRAENYLKSKSDFGYCELEVDAVSDSIDKTILGQESRPSWFKLSDIKINILNFTEGHTYISYIALDPSELANTFDNYETPALYLDTIKTNSFYIPFSEYQFKNKISGNYGYQRVLGVYVFDITDIDDFVPDFDEAILYEPDINYDSIPKVAHYAGIGVVSLKTVNYVISFQQYPPAYNSVTHGLGASFYNT